MPDGIEDSLLLQADRTEIHTGLQLIGIQDDRLAVGSFGRTQVAAAQPVELDALQTAVTAGQDAATRREHLQAEGTEASRAVGAFEGRLQALAAERAAVELEAEARESGDLASYHLPISYLRTAIIGLRELPVFDENETGFEPIEALLRWLVEYSEGRADG